LSKEVGFTDPRIISSEKIEIHDPEVKSKVGNIKFYSITYRLFKIKDLENECEDYGHEVTYKGTLRESEEAFKLDNGHIFKKCEKVKICGNSYRMLKDTRFKEHFDFEGNWDTHLGLFDTCGTESPLKNIVESEIKFSCC
jgi:arsenite methyltransferase